VVHAHAVFAADLSLVLPDGATLDAVNTSTDTGVWQSVTRTVSDVPHILERLRGRIAEVHERIATIDREHTRLERWDGQATHDGAVSELNAINAVFVAEEQAGAEQGQTTVAAPAGGAVPVAGKGEHEHDLTGELLALARAEGADEGWKAWATRIPSAPASLAWMAKEVACQTLRAPLHAEPCVVEQPEAEGFPAASTGRIQLGDRAGQRRPGQQNVPLPISSETEVRQLSLF